MERVPQAHSQLDAPTASKQIAIQEVMKMGPFSRDVAITLLENCDGDIFRVAQRLSQNEFQKVSEVIQPVDAQLRPTGEPTERHFYAQSHGSPWTLENESWINVFFKKNINIYIYIYTNLWWETSLLSLPFSRPQVFSLHMHHQDRTEKADEVAPDEGEQASWQDSPIMEISDDEPVASWPSGITIASDVRMLSTQFCFIMQCVYIQNKAEEVSTSQTGGGGGLGLDFPRDHMKFPKHKINMTCMCSVAFVSWMPHCFHRARAFEVRNPYVHSPGAEPVPKVPFLLSIWRHASKPTMCCKGCGWKHLELKL